MQPRNVLIALPTTGQSMKSATAITVARLVQHLGSRGIGSDLHNIDSAEIVTARDMFANMLLYTDRWDALVFIDSDMGFDPQLVGRMIDLDEEVVGIASTRRNLDMAALINAIQNGEPQGRAIARASAFIFKPHWGGEPVAVAELRDGFAPGAAMGMGLAYIARTAITAMIDGKVVRPRLDLNAGPGRTCYSFFEPTEEDGHRLGEDFSFCHRWTRRLGRTVWVCIDTPIAHIGNYEYQARYIDLL